MSLRRICLSALAARTPPQRPPGPPSWLPAMSCAPRGPAGPACCPGRVAGNLLPAGGRLHEGQPCPPGAGQAVGLAEAVAPAHGPRSVCASLLFLWVPLWSLSWGEAGRAEREGLGGDGCRSPPTSHLPPLALRTRSLLLLAGTGPAWPSDPRPGSRSACVYRSNSSGRPPLAPRPLPESCGGAPSGSGRLESPRAPPPPGPPESQGARRPPRKRARRDPPSLAPARGRSGPARAGAEAVGPAQGGRQEPGPSGRPAAPEEQARAGVAVPLAV